MYSFLCIYLKYFQWLSEKNIALVSLFCTQKGFYIILCFCLIRFFTVHIAPDKAAYCVFTQFRGPENAIK